MPASDSRGVSPSPTSTDDPRGEALHSMERSTITQALLDLGSALLSSFADPAADYDQFAPAKVMAEQTEEKPIDGNIYAAVAKLNKACQKTFGAVGDILKFEFLEEYGPLRKRCVLDIVRPDGQKRSYTTKPEFQRKGEAKMKAASLAIERGALQFIFWGDDAKGKGGEYALALTDIGTIERCCQEWRAERIMPYWVYTGDPKTGLVGCAMRIKLSAHHKRVYSVAPKFDSQFDAKLAAAQVAMGQDIIGFIKHGDGQKEPMPASAEYNLPDSSDISLSIPESAPSRKDKATQDLLAHNVVNLQIFFDSLPQPLPEPVGIKGGDQTNPVAWINQAIQQHKGSQLSLSFAWSVDPKLGLHGCVLRLDHPSGDSHSYMVDPVFSKRQDAKTAVCLEAISQNVGDYVRSTGTKYDERLTKEMKDYAKEHVFGLITQDLQRLKPPQRATWAFDNHKGVFGCRLTVPIDEESSRTYATAIEYRNRADAKAAVALLAVEQGALEFIRFRGKPTPPDYNRDAYDWKQYAPKKGDNTNNASKKADSNLPKNNNASSNTNSKKRKQSEDSPTGTQPPLFETRSEALARGRYLNSKRSNNKNHGPGVGRGPSANGRPLAPHPPGRYSRWHPGDERSDLLPFAPPRGPEPPGMYLGRGYHPADQDGSQEFSAWPDANPSPIPASGRVFSSLPPQVRSGDHVHPYLARSSAAPDRPNVDGLSGGSIPPAAVPVNGNSSAAKGDDLLVSVPQTVSGPGEHRPPSLPAASTLGHAGYSEPLMHPRRVSRAFPGPDPRLDLVPTPYYDDSRPAPRYSSSRPGPPEPYPGREYYARQGYDNYDPRWLPSRMLYENHREAYDYEYSRHRGHFPYPPVHSDYYRDRDPYYRREEYPRDFPHYRDGRSPTYLYYDDYNASRRWDQYPLDSRKSSSPSMRMNEERGRMEKPVETKDLSSRKRPLSHDASASAETLPSLAAKSPLGKKAKTNSPGFGNSAVVSSPTLELHSIFEPSNFSKPSPSDTIEAGQLPSPTSDAVMDTTSVTSEALGENASPVSDLSPEQTTFKSYFSQLLDFCKNTNQPEPKLHTHATPTTTGEEYTVWIIMGKERLELPTRFSSVSVGEEKLSKQVLARMKKAHQQRNSITNRKESPEASVAITIALANNQSEDTTIP
ncbi:hypothetical protein BS47DRAFT_1336199 [Hydnum rufescens UP504]|uniref:Uncharacterized protein n=1 Tax=Hydnum rufescens UP504 TaxID=1448309 RepID=A0A9P6B9W5_9AGAM|nr:hypothetical protein BS47DRAFT_1336199 [Hydnum rufescens UP504]